LRLTVLDHFGPARCRRSSSAAVDGSSRRFHGN
jgi:hypothetical protein